VNPSQQDLVWMNIGFNKLSNALQRWMIFFEIFAQAQRRCLLLYFQGVQSPLRFGEECGIDDPIEVVHTDVPRTYYRLNREMELITRWIFFPSKTVSESLWKNFCQIFGICKWKFDNRLKWKSKLASALCCTKWRQNAVW
jgi:hypothetical protein